jgi:hypothetical protein
MNKSSMRLLALFTFAALLAPIAVMAQSPPLFNIPFGFTAGTQSFAAGEYQVGQLSSHVIRVQSTDGHANMLLLANADEPGKVPGIAKLVFHRYGNQYFLARMADDNHGWAFLTPASEKELIAGQRARKQLEIVASTGK